MWWAPLLFVVYSVLGTLAALTVLERRFPALAGPERIALASLSALAFAGWAPLVFGSIPGLGVAGGLAVTLLVGLAGSAGILAKFGKPTFKSQLPNRSVWILLGGLGLIPIIKALSPSDTLDWDTLAYHFAVPKLWLQANSFHHIPFIHQSNFPFLVDNLFLFGLGAGLEPLAKAMTFLYWILGGLWVYGVASRHFGDSVATWCAAAFASCPLVLWSSGSGYIDVAHGLFAAIGLLYAAESLSDPDSGKATLYLSGFGLGGAMGSKFTGLQVALITLVLVVLFAVRLGRLRGFARPLLGAGALAVVMACPWYVRNIVNTGNPVFPFFYEQLGGRGWDQWRADIYRDEQQTFGVGRTESGRNPMALGHSLLGLGYQPGRYINPGQNQGGGVPMGAVGIPLLLAPIAWLGVGSKRGRWIFVLAASGLLLLGFFFLSQQVRYTTALIPVWALLFGAILHQKPGWSKGFKALIGVQGAYAVAMIYLLQTTGQLASLGSLEARTAYQTQSVRFATFAPEVNRLVGEDGKVALFDEVFGYFLDVPYYWANPGHSQIIPFETISSGAEYGTALRSNGTTHVYLNLGYLDPRRSEMLRSALSGIGPTSEDIAAYDGDLNLKWFRLLADAVATQELVVEKEFVVPGRQSVSALLFRVALRG